VQKSCWNFVKCVLEMYQAGFVDILLYVIQSIKYDGDDVTAVNL